MEHWLTAEAWEKLTAAEKAAHCRRMAEEAKALATGAKSTAHGSLLQISAQWLTLADELECHGRP